jgi:hypothetical protein
VSAFLYVDLDFVAEKEKNNLDRDLLANSVRFGGPEAERFQKHVHSWLENKQWNDYRARSLGQQHDFIADGLGAATKEVFEKVPPKKNKVSTIPS